MQQVLIRLIFSIFGSACQSFFPDFLVICVNCILNMLFWHRKFLSGLVIFFSFEASNVSFLTSKSLHSKGPLASRVERMNVCIEMRYVTHMDESCHTYGWVISHIWMSHFTHMNESCHTYGWVMSHIWMSHVTHMDESCHTCEWVMSHIWMSHVTHMDESYHTYRWVMSHIWMSHVTHVNESCQT